MIICKIYISLGIKHRKYRTCRRCSTPSVFFLLLFSLMKPYVSLYYSYPSSCFSWCSDTRTPMKISSMKESMENAWRMSLYIIYTRVGIKSWQLFVFPCKINISRWNMEIQEWKWMVLGALGCMNNVDFKKISQWQHCARCV